MKFELVWSVDAVTDLGALNKVTADRITRKVGWFSRQTNPLRHADQLSGHYIGIYRFRVGEYRILFEKDYHGRLCVLVVLRVKHRRHVYR
jgi:mRNA interferase RelE/StbE